MNKLYIYKNVNTEKIIETIANDYNIKNKKIIRNEYGKPYFENSSIYFNISNSNDISVFVVSDKEIGIDIQKIKYSEAVLNRSYTENENKYVEMSSNKEKAFTIIWTMKESYVKMLGIGISYGLQNVDTITLKDRFQVIEYEDCIITICN